MAFVHYDRERWCTRCGEKKPIMVFCPDCHCRLRYKKRMHHTVARAIRLIRNKEAWPSAPVVITTAFFTQTNTVNQSPALKKKVVVVDNIYLVARPVFWLNELSRVTRQR